MGNRSIIYLTFLVLVCMAVLFLMNYQHMFSPDLPQPYLKTDNVRGIAVEYQGKLYTLNFTQQNRVVDILNRSLKIERIDKNEIQELPGISKIEIYRFTGSDVILTPIAYIRNDLVYENKEWNPNGYLMEVSDGMLREIIKSATQ